MNEPANVTINGQNARVSADGTFESLTPVGPGQQDVLMQATDKAGNTTSQTWRVDNGPAGTVTTTHDAEGNLLTDGRYTYTWDAKNRMTSVTLGSDTWTFQYDGQNRRIAESKNGLPVRMWVWSGSQIREERAANGSRQIRWKGGVVQLINNQVIVKRIHLNDHLGSARAAVDGTDGSIIASYAFSPWGKRSRIAGTEDLSTGYTGHLWHESGLSLAVYRPYDPETGRWPSRDPILEVANLNLYMFAANDPIDSTDEIGLCCEKELEAFNKASDALISASKQRQKDVSDANKARAAVAIAVAAVAWAAADITANCVPGGPYNPKCSIAIGKMVTASAGLIAASRWLENAEAAEKSSERQYQKASKLYDSAELALQLCLSLNNGSGSGTLNPNPLL